MTEILKKGLHFARVSGKIVKLIILIPYFTLGGASTMAKCECCGKGVTFGIKVSHSHRRSNRTWTPTRLICVQSCVPSATSTTHSATSLSDLS